MAPAAGQLQLDGKISARGDQLIAASGTVPLLLSARPLAVAVPQAGRLDLHLAGDGKLEKLAQILPMGEDRITGDYRVALGVGGTPARPDIGGKIAIADASYLNQDYGTELRGLALELTGNQSRLQLTRLAARDSRSGTLEGSGDLDLAGAAPRLDFQARLTNFLVANSDEAKAPVDADIRAQRHAGRPQVLWPPHPAAQRFPHSGPAAAQHRQSQCRRDRQPRSRAHRRRSRRGGAEKAGWRRGCSSPWMWR